jgi:paired amphipathic helix protein Sin3a
MSIFLSGRDYKIGSAVSSEERWAYYMYSLMSLNPTEGLIDKTKKPFLKRLKRKKYPLNCLRSLPVPAGG